MHGALRKISIGIRHISIRVAILRMIASYPRIAPLTYFFCSDFDETFLAYVPDDFKQKQKKLSKFFFFNYIFLPNLFFLFFESSETHSDQVAGKIGLKLNNLDIYGDEFCQFSKSFEHETDHISKTKN